MRILIFIFALFQLSLAAQENSTVRGFVYDKENGEAIPFCTVMILNSKYACVTDVNGFFSINKLAAGKYFVVTRFIGYANDTVEISLKAEEILTIKVYLGKNTLWFEDGDPITYQEPLIEPNTLPGGTVTRIDFYRCNLAGKITEGTDTNGVPFAVIECINDVTIKAVSDFNGNYSLKNIPCGKYLFRFYEAGNENGCKLIPVFLAPGQAITINLNLCENNIVLWEVVQTKQNPLANNYILLSDSSKKSGTTNENSSLKSDSLLMHRYEIDHAHRNGNFANYYFLKHSVLNQFDDSTFYFDCNDNGCQYSVLYMKKGDKFVKAKGYHGTSPASFTIRKRKNSLKLKCKGAHARLKTSS